MRRLKDKSGVALAAVILAIVIVSIFSGVVLVASTSEVKQTAIQQKSTRAYYLARSAVDTLSSDVLKKVVALGEKASQIRSAADKLAYDTAVSDFFATCVPAAGSYTHTVTIPNAFSSGSNYQVPVTVVTTASVNGTATIYQVNLTSNCTLDGTTSTSQAKMQLQISPAAKSIEITDSGIFSHPFVTSGSISLGSNKSVGDLLRSVKGKSGMITIQGLTDPTAILNQFGITVKDSSSLPVYTAAALSGITALPSGTINTSSGPNNNITGYSITGNFNRSLKIMGTYGKDVYLFDNDSSIVFNGGGYFASNSGADVILIAPNATSIDLTGNFLSSVPNGYNASCFYIFAPNADVTMGGSFNGMYGSVFAKSVTIPAFNFGSSNKQYIVNYRQLLPSSDPSWDLDISIPFDSLTAGSRTWVK